MKTKVLFVVLSLAAVVASANLWSESGNSPSLYADKMITTSDEARV
ncbi:hypothetical protein VSK91_12965 [Bacillus swezeyi]